jgi:hypothetical protein
MVNFFYLDKDPKKCAEYYCNKHVLKIPIEIAQILSKIHHVLKSGIDYTQIYINSIVVKNTIGPYLWTIESYDNYIWTCKLGLELINEFKLRYNRDAHKTESVLQFLLNNPPKLPKIGITKFRGTNKFDMFQYISNDPIVCARYAYAELKCDNDSWSGRISEPLANRKVPGWFIEIKDIITKKKEKLINKINIQVRDRLPSLVKPGDRVYRYHSFLRVSYDHLFQGKWDFKAKFMNKYDSNKPLLHQLTYPQLYFIYKITKSLENKQVLNLLNIESLKYRKKLKFPNKNINYKTNPEYYIYTHTEEGVLTIEPYKSEILPFWRFKTIEESKESSNKIYDLFLEYIKKEDMLGADMARKYIQMGVTRAKRYYNWKGGNKSNEKFSGEKSKLKSSNLFGKKLILVKNNINYLEWIKSYNWKNKNPFKPGKYIL